MINYLVILKGVCRHSHVSEGKKKGFVKSIAVADLEFCVSDGLLKLCKN